MVLLKQKSGSFAVSPMRSFLTRSGVLPMGFCFLLSLCLFDITAFGQELFSKPTWLFELSLGVKESYDDNVFLSGVDQKYLPKVYVVPAGSVAALKDSSSLVTTVSSIGKVPYFDSLYDLTCHHKWTDQFAFDLGGRISSEDFTVANLKTCLRDDWQYAVNACASYAVNDHASLALSYSHDFGRSMEDGVTNPSTRAFERDLVSVGALVSF